MVTGKTCKGTRSESAVGVVDRKRGAGITAENSKMDGNKVMFYRRVMHMYTPPLILWYLPREKYTENRVSVLSPGYPRKEE